MKIEHRILIYLVLLHLIFATGFALLLREHRLWLPLVELLTVISLLIAVRLIRRVGEPQRLIDVGVQLIRGGDFTTRFEERGQPELDGLIQVYNRMVDVLLRERVRNGEQECFLQQIMEVSPQGIVIMDYDRRIDSVNRGGELFLGEERGSLAGRSLKDLRSPLAAELATLQAEESRVITWRSGRRLKLRKGEFRDSGFQREFYLVQELTEELRQSEKAAYGKLIRMMAHEVNNTIGSVSTLLRSCLTYAPQVSSGDREDFQNAMEVGGSRLENMNRFMKRFADVIRIPPPNLQNCDLEEITSNLIHLLESEAERREIVLLRSGDPHVTTFRGDQVLLEQALVNILRNSLEAIENSGTVELKLSTSEDHPVLEIVDDGAGIDGETHGKLFTPFFTTKSSGQGIGLTVTREILEGHGFTYELTSSSGGPTCFRVNFSNRSGESPSSS